MNMLFRPRPKRLTVGLYFEKPIGSFRGCTRRESRLFMAGMATPLPTPMHTRLLF